MNNIINLTNPGQPPVAGDLVRVIHSDTCYEEKLYSEPYTEQPVLVSRVMTKLAFLRRMTQAERVAFRQAAKVDPVLEDFMALLDLAMDVNKDDPDVISGLQKAEQAGLLATGRAAEILA